MKTVEKEMVIIAGANGSGKTTLGIPYVKELGYDYLNADEIAKKLEEAGEQDAIMIKAGRIFFRELEKCLKRQSNFIVETTLSGTYIQKLVERAKQQGYVVKMIYIFLDNADLCVERVRIRVLKGGHDVPEEDIRRRFGRSLNNFWVTLILLYNGDKGFQPVVIGLKENYRVESEYLFEQFKKLVDGES